MWSRRAVDRVSDPLLLQHMADCARRQDRVDASIVRLEEKLDCQDRDNDAKHTQNIRAMESLRKSAEEGRQKILFWLLTTAVTIIMGLAGMAGGMAYLIVTNTNK